MSVETLTTEIAETAAAADACVSCQARPTRSATGRLPRGWKQAPALVCPACLRDRYQVVAITVPVASPLDATWAELGAALREAWGETTRAANWIVTELYARDVRRLPADTKLRPMPATYLYPALRAVCPALTPIHATSLIQAVERTYREQRYELLWTGTRSLAVHRYPVPLPLHPQGYAIEPTSTPDDPIVVRVRIGDRWWRLRLRRGPEFRRQIAQIRQVQSGVALRGTGALLSVRAHQSDHRPGVDPGDGLRSRVLIKIVAWVPRPSITVSDETLTVETDASALWVCRRPRKVVVLQVSGEMLRRGISAYTTRRERLQADLAVERRWIPRERAAVEQRLQRLHDRHARARRTWIQQSAALVARYAAQHGLSVAYADEERAFAGDLPMPWQQMRLALQHAVTAAGCPWTYASGAPMTAVPRKRSSPLADRTSGDESCR